MVHATLGPQSQDFKFLVSKDGSKILQGSVYDVNNNPFKTELDKLKTDGAPNFGTPGAPVVIVEFSDFECPFCKEEATMLRANLPVAYPNQVQVYFKEFPLESIHPWAKAAAIASRCVFRQSPTAFWDFHDWIFAHQAEITPENLKDKMMEWAKVKGASIRPSWAPAWTAKATEAEVEPEPGGGTRVGRQTRRPRCSSMAGRIPGQVDWPALKNIIDYEIEYQKTAKNAGEDCGCDLKLNLPGQMPAAEDAAVAPPKK